MHESAVTFTKVCKKIHQALAKEGKDLHVSLGRLEVWNPMSNKLDSILCPSG